MNYIPKWVTSINYFDDSESDTDEPNNFEKTVVAAKITIKEEENNDDDEEKKSSEDKQFIIPETAMQIYINSIGSDDDVPGTLPNVHCCGGRLRGDL
jgi:hypothetical protein